MMNRLFGGGNKARAQPATNLQLQKNKQIESLRKTSAKEVIRDVEYRLAFPLASTNITLIIRLPAQFPQEQPVVTVQPLISHPWVNSQSQVVGCPALNTFTMHSDLGQAVQSIVEEFKRNPPSVPQQPFLGAPAMPAGGYRMPTPHPGYPAPPPPVYPPPPGPVGGSYIPPASPAGLSHGSREMGPLPSTMAQSSRTDDFAIPDIQKTFPALKDKKLQELQELVESDDQILELIQNLPELKRFAEERDELANQCVKQAEENLALKPVVEELKQSVLRKASELEHLKHQFEEHCARHMVLSEQFHPTNIQSNLKVAIMEAEEESEKIATDFFNIFGFPGKMDVDEFMENFLKTRELCHLRRAKEEKLNQIIINSGY